ncbi:hydrogen peroxide-inducible genes activator [Corynebacterium tapiri]|uniref:Probable hydrogen peroxide-inducible genes activator n=1 Tax=Corynebacterium tapiri TaxID=1448266 RepID=A0A5C4U5R3_9CORY|nr:hydrogen peroxide-inducible genes activator [Corynebacterium tapiri]TNL99212.1 hydrogen peroxide-inducible genes activator [Corynebacterium tapiri]
MSSKEYRPTLAQLRTFVTIAEQKHFGSAAAQLGISQPSLSQALSALEQGLDLQLIERSTRRVIVTTPGERLLPYAKATLEAADAFLAHSRGASGTLSGPVSIGIIPTAAPYILTELLRILGERFPNVEPRIVEEQTASLLHRLRDGQIDAAFLALPTEATGVIELPLYREPFSVVLPTGHALAGRNDLQVADLNDVELLLLDDGHCLRDQVLDLCRRADVNPMTSLSSATSATSLTTTLQLVIGGLGATLVPASALAQEQGRPGMAVAHFAPEVDAGRTMGVVFRGSSSRAEEYAQLGQCFVEAYERSVGQE